MMMTMRPTSVTSMETSSSSHGSAVDALFYKTDIGTTAASPATNGQRKRMKSAGDSGRIYGSAGSPAPLISLETVKESGKKNSFLSRFSKSKPKSAKTRSVDITSEALDSPSSVSENLGNNNVKDTPTSTAGISLSYSSANSGNGLQTTGTKSFAVKKGFQRSISIPAAPTLIVKKDNKTFHPGDGYEDFPCKYDCPPTPVKQIQSKTPCESVAPTPSIGEMLQALSGPPLNNKLEDVSMPTSGSDDRSPLIDREITTQKLAAVAATSFDNIASVTEADQPQSVVSRFVAPATVGVGSGESGNVSPASTFTTISSTPSSTVFFPGSGNLSSSSDKASKGSNSQSSNKPPPNVSSNIGGKKRKPLASLILASSKESSGMRQLSASEERKIDEAMQLASQLALLSANDHAALPSPRSISGSSKESLESPALTSSSTSFFGGFRRRPHPEKRTFADGLQASLGIDAAERMFTPDAQAAYNQLVASSPPACDPLPSKAPSGRRHEIREHRRQVLEAPFPRHHQRSSLSESDQELVARVAVPFVFKAPAERRPATKRSISLSDDAPKFPIEITPKASSAASDSTLSPQLSVVADSEDQISRTESISGEISAIEKSSTTDADTLGVDQMQTSPPPLPPRIPLRRSTVNVQPRQRNHPLGASQSTSSSSSMSHLRGQPHHPYRPSSANSKLRSVSEAVPLTHRRAPPDPILSLAKPSAAADVPLPRRVTRSTADAEDAAAATRRGMLSSVGSDSSGQQRFSIAQESTSSDDSSVFAADRDDEDDNDPPPSSPAPLPPKQSSSYSRAMSIARPSPQLSATAKRRLNARQLGFDNDHDDFWTNPVDFRQISGGLPSTVAHLSKSEENLLQQLIIRPTPARYDTSDDVSYEDLMEFALDGPRSRRPPSDEGECDEVRLMKKLLSKDVTTEECVDALSDTRWDVYSAMKLIKLNMLLNAGLAGEQQCKQALMACCWNVDDAVNYLLASPPSD